MEINKMTVSLQPVRLNEKQILQNLYSLYLHDLSRYNTSLELSVNGSFEFDVFESIWEEEGLSPFFLKKNETIIGFLLLLERPFLKKEYDHAVNDIFILNKFRGKGYGYPALKELFKKKSGNYFVIELAKNLPAVSFWKKVYKSLEVEFEEREETLDGENCLIQTFHV
jgi:predicted acetyltransferase